VKILVSDKNLGRGSATLQHSTGLAASPPLRDILGLARERNWNRFRNSKPQPDWENSWRRGSRGHSSEA